MAIEITKLGKNALEDRTFTGSCGLCETEVEFAFRDATWLTRREDHQTTKVAEIRCPLCSERIRVAAAAWREQVPSPSIYLR